MTDQNNHFDSRHNEEISEDIDIRKLIDDISDRLAGMTREERLAWFRKAQYPYSVNFQREIGGTIYTVNAHFDTAASESIQEKAKRILLKL